MSAAALTPGLPLAVCLAPLGSPAQATPPSAAAELAVARRSRMVSFPITRMSLLSFDTDTETLTVKSPFDDAQLSIRRYDSAGTFFYDFSVTLKHRSVSNDAVSFWPIPDFLTSLDAFERSRSDEAVLDGTYDCRLVVRPHSVRGDAWLEFCVCEYLMLHRQPADRDLYGHYSLSGGISVHGEDVAALRDCFRQLFSESAPANV